jgi:toxin HigB-1
MWGKGLDGLMSVGLLVESLTCFITLLDYSDLKAPPGNRLKRLKGDMSGYHSIRINDQWRILFIWSKAGPSNVQITDYH